MSSKVILSDYEMDEKVQEFRKWISLQSHLPQNIGKNNLGDIKNYSYCSNIWRLLNI